jgi:hypothetical protein
MISGDTFTFSNVMIGAFVSSQTADKPYISFQDVTHMNDIWRVRILSFIKTKNQI